MPIFKRVKRCIESSLIACGVLLAGIVTYGSKANADWSIDLSRRNLKTRETELNAASRPDRQPASVHGGQSSGSHTIDSAGATSAGSEVLDTTAKALPAKSGVLDTVFDAGEPIQDMVILLTDKGFTPATVRVKKGGRYRVHVVNVNEKEKNVSFMLDGFSEHHAIYYGKIKVFVLEPRKEGAFSFQSPETSSEGKLIVFNPQLSVRSPSSEE